MVLDGLLNGIEATIPSETHATRLFGAPYRWNARPRSNTYAMNRIFQEHQQRNADSRDRWACFASHRLKVTELLIGSSSDRRDRLCVLGAGNCNDLNLSALSSHFAEVHLVDLDADAVQGGMALQGITDTQRVQVHGGIDLAGCNTIVGDWSPDRPPADPDVQRCIDVATNCPLPFVPGPFDVVASVCLLTQLFDSIAMSLGGSHPRFMDVITGIRLRHVRMLFELLQPGGAALLIMDFVSSGTFPQLETTSENDLPALAAALIKSRNFFTGTNPGVLHSLFKTDEALAPQVSRLEVTRPWLWDFGPRTYAVCAVCARKYGDER